MVFADIHGNIEALEQVLHDAEQRRVDRRICLGDLVGYGPHPNACIERVRDLPKCRCLAGNHDVAALWQTSPYGMSAAAKEAILWTMDKLTPASREFLASRPDRLDLADMTFVHANPYNPRGWRYVMDRKYALRSFAATSCRYLFLGHTHRPLVMKRRNFLSVQIMNIAGPMQVEIHDTKRQIVNCGSIGQPRDLDPRASYLIFDTRLATMEFHRVKYDTSITAREIVAAGLPPVLSRRLLKGT